MKTEGRTMAERKPQIDNVVPYFVWKELMILAQVTSRTEQVVARKSLPLVADALSNNLQREYGKACTRALSIVYNFIDPNLLFLFRWEVMDKILGKQNVNNFDTGNVTDKDSGSYCQQMTPWPKWQHS